MSEDDQQTYAEFGEAVNMTAGQLRTWLATEESRGVGQKDSAGAESVGHEMGREIVQLLGKKKGELSQEDYGHMRKVVGYVRRRSAQRPDGDVTDTRWRYSLMNWGHDPLK